MGFGFGKMEWDGFGVGMEFGLIFGRIRMEVGSTCLRNLGSQSSMTSAIIDIKDFNWVRTVKVSL